MRTIEVRNVNYAYAEAIRLLLREGKESKSRDGDVLTLDTPVMTVYHRPWERVLFEEKRDANPFFHLFESLWMLSGRDDAAFLNTYVRDFGLRFAQTDGRIHGAYGKRWRSWFNMDQIKVVCQRLHANPDDRRVVVAMWDPELDLGSTAKDVPCNTHLYPRIVNGCLDLTVMCRSNDAVWGAYGANAVHFSILQEYMAGLIGIQSGWLYQFSNNLHIYTRMLPKVGVPELGLWGTDKYMGQYVTAEIFDVGDTELKYFMEWHDTGLDTGLSAPLFTSRFLQNVCVPMVIIHRLFSSGQKQEALEYCENIVATDWQLACAAWIGRRMKSKMLGLSDEPL